MNNSSNLIICVGRQYGSGGMEIGKIIAQELNLSFYDKEILSLSAKESGYCEAHFEKNDEKVSPSWLDPFGGFSDKKLFSCQSETIRKLAEENRCLFIGRCADYILRDYPNLFNLFISAPLEKRIENVCQRLQISEKEAQELIQKTDKVRSSYYNFYTGREWGMAESYNLCVDSSLLGLEQTAEKIINFIPVSTL